MTAIQRRLPVNDAGDPAGPACPDGRLLALRCLDIPQVATRAAMSRRRTLQDLTLQIIEEGRAEP
jgi:hypothetical protein